MKVHWSAVMAMGIGSIALAQTDEEMRKLKEAAAREQDDEMKGLPKRVSDLEKKVNQQKLEDKSTFRAYWKDGLYFETGDKAFSLHVGGRIYFHYHSQDYDNELIERLGSNGQNGIEHETQEGFKFRTVRFRMDGTIYEHIFYDCEWEFANNNDIRFKDTWIGIKNIPIADMGNFDVRFGHFKEPFSLETLTSSRYITFTERSLLKNAFVAEFNPGVIINSRWFNDVTTLSFSLTKQEAAANGNSFSPLTDGRYAFTVRATGCPWYERDGEEVLHLGIDYSRRDTVAGVAAGNANRRGTVTYATRAETDVGPTLLSTGAINAFEEDRVDLEAAAVWGAFSVQFEYMFVIPHVYGAQFAGLDDPFLWGYYVEVSWFITGEHRNYKRSAGAFDRVKPKANFFVQDGGWGAWQIAFRYSYLDLEAGGIPDAPAGEPMMSEITIGINWYLNPNTRIMFDYAVATMEGHGPLSDTTGGVERIFTIRWQIDF